MTDSRRARAHTHTLRADGELHVQVQFSDSTPVCADLVARGEGGRGEGEHGAKTARVPEHQCLSCAAMWPLNHAVKVLRIRKRKRPGIEGESSRQASLGLDILGLVTQNQETCNACAARMRRP